MKASDVVTALALIFAGIVFSIFLLQAIDRQARIDSREAVRAHIARAGR